MLKMKRHDLKKLCSFLAIICKRKERGISLFGPHRDDISFDVNGMDAQTYGSQDSNVQRLCPLN